MRTLSLLLVLAACGGPTSTDAPAAATSATPDAAVLVDGAQPAAASDATFPMKEDGGCAHMAAMADADSAPAAAPMGGCAEHAAMGGCAERAAMGGCAEHAAMGGCGGDQAAAGGCGQDCDCPEAMKAACAEHQAAMASADGGCGCDHAKVQ